MATPQEQQLVAQYGQGMQDLINAERAKNSESSLIKGVNVDPQDVGGLVAAFGKLNPQGVFSTSNIVGASTNPAQRPDDLLGIRNQIGTELGLPGLNQQYQDIFNQLQAFDQNATGTQIGLENQPVSLNVIRGQQAEAGRQSAFAREGLARKAQVAQSALAAAQQEQQARFAIRQQEVQLKQQLILENPGAGITFGDSIESAAAKIQRYNLNEKRAEEEKAKKAEESAYKARLREMAIQLGVSTKTKKGGTRSADQLYEAIAEAVGSEKELERQLKLDKANEKKTEKEETSYTATEQRKMINEALAGGDDWNGIYETFNALGIDTAEDSVMDKYLKQKFGY